MMHSEQHAGRRFAAIGLVLGIVGAGIAGTASADDLFVGGPQGAVFRADTANGAFTFAGVCGGPIQSMVQSAQTVLLGDQDGNVYRLSLDSGQVDYYFTVQNSDNTDMVMVGDQLLLSSLSGLIRRVEPSNGSVVGTLMSPVPVRTMAVDGNFLYVAGDNGDVHRADLSTGVFSYFACVCLSQVNSIVFVDNFLIAADQNGFGIRFDRTTGQPIDSLFTNGDNTEAVPAGGERAFFATSTGTVRLMDTAEGGQVIATLQAPINVQGMVLIQQPTCVADFNHDDQVDSNDLFRFIEYLLVGKISADVNGDGQLASDDFFIFLAAFFAGCA